MSTSELLDFDLTTAPPDEITFKLASTREEREAAFRLIYNSYLQAGLTAENCHKIRITPYHLQPSTAMFIAVLRDEVVSSVSLVCDDELGVPIHQLYPDEVQQRRDAGLRLGEVTCLADRRKSLARRLSLLIGLFRMMVQYARQEGLDQLLITVHPRHAAFYQRYLAFDKVGDERAYAAVLNNPAVALSLDFARIDRERPINYAKFFGVPLPEEQLRPQPMDWQDREYFAALYESCQGTHRLVG